MNKIDILLTTFNGENFLDQQLDSLLNQNYQNFKILIRDDGSTDKTLEIIEQYQQLSPNKFFYIKDTLGNIGSSRSFMQLLEYSDAEFIMFCDQDDIWLPQKIQISLDKMQSIQNHCKKMTPVLTFTDLQVVDEKLNIIAGSYWQYQKLIPDVAKSWKILLAQNVVTGCTIMMNAEARKICIPYALNLMHDQWVSVMVSKNGIIEYLQDTTVMYRQHQNNADGAHRFKLAYIWKKLQALKNPLLKLKLSSDFFGDISLMQLIKLKVIINIKRFFQS